MNSKYTLVEEAGLQAPWLTLVHGATQSRRLFDAQVADFRAHYRLLLVDLAGHGEAALVPGPFGPLEYTAGVLEAMDAAGVRQTHYWGTHTGTQVGLLIALKRPTFLSSLILEGAVIPGRSVPSVTQCFERARTTALKLGLRAAQTEWFERSPWFEVMRTRPVKCRAALQRRIIEHFPGHPWLSTDEPEHVALSRLQLGSIMQPTLLVNGEFEVPDFLPAAKELESSLPSVRRVMVPEAGGFPLWEYPDSTNAIVKMFLRDVEVHT